MFLFNLIGLKILELSGFPNILSWQFWAESTAMRNQDTSFWKCQDKESSLFQFFLPILFWAELIKSSKIFGAVKKDTVSLFNPFQTFKT